MSRSRGARLRSLLGPAFGAAIFLGALATIRAEFAGGSVASVRTALVELPSATVLLAILLTGINYCALVGYDLLALGYIGRKMPLRHAALAATAGNAFSQALGFPLLTGAPIRFRLYSAWGLDRLDVAKLISFCIVTFWLGLFAFGGTVLLLSPLEWPAEASITSRWWRPLGGLLILPAAAYWIWCSRTHRPLRVRNAVFAVPTGRVAALQIVVGSMEWLAQASVLWAVLPAELGLGFLETIGLFVVAQVVAIASQVPGGVAVFEAVILWYLPDVASEAAVLGVLLFYRLIYYVLPLLVGGILVSVIELRAHRGRARELAAMTAGAVSGIAPRAVAALAFLTGTVLVLGSALPLAEGTRLWLTSFVPLPVFELSHFAASLAGAGLLVLARGLQRRLDGAYHITVALVGLTVLSSVPRGVALGTLVPAAVLLGVLLVSRPEFHRKSSLFSESFTPGWVVAILLVVATSMWLGWFSYARVEYSADLWWTFTFAGNAPRFLRSVVGVAGVLGLFGVARLLRPARVAHTDAGSEVLARIAPIVASAPRVTANLALVGDKQILLSPTQRSFVMYGVEGDSWIAMGDPVGDSTEFIDLAWRFRDLADRAGDSTVFYQATDDQRALYLELGLSLLKIGEDASVELASFNFDGSRRADFRKAVRRLEEAGGTFEVIDPEHVPAVLDELRSVSDSWLETRNTSEKGFSLGAFEPSYILRNPVGVVRVGQRVVAFGNIWRAGQTEVSFDLIRQLPDAPKSTMDYMFAQLITWGRAQGIARMALGMAPLSGLDDDPLAPLWNRVGAAVFRYGGHFYNFQGLRAYKEKFDPVWEPRYLASPAGFSLPGILADLASLIAGGLSGIVRR